MKIFQHENLSHKNFLNYGSFRWNMSDWHRYDCLKCLLVSSNFCLNQDDVIIISGFPLRDSILS